MAETKEFETVVKLFYFSFVSVLFKLCEKFNVAF